MRQLEERKLLIIAKKELTMQILLAMMSKKAEELLIDK